MTGKLMRKVGMTDTLNMIVAFAIFSACLFAQAYGSIPLYLCFAIIIINFAAYPTFYIDNMKLCGIVPWLFPLYMIASTGWSPVPETTLRFGLQVVLTLIFAVQITATLDWRRFLDVTILACGLACAASIISGKMGLDALTGRMNLVGIIGNKNSLGYCASILVIFSANAAIGNNCLLITRIYYIISVLLGLLITFKSGSIGALVSLIIGMGSYIVIAVPSLYPRNKRSDVLSICLATSIIVSMILIVPTYAFSDEILRFFGKEPTLTGRTTLWYYAARIWPEHPILGMGSAGFWVQGYGPAEALWRLMHIETRAGFHFHNLFYQTLVDTGLLGLLLILFYIIFSFANKYRDLQTDFSLNSCAYFAAAFYTLVMQTQGVDLMQPFQPAFLIFAIADFYARQNRRLNIIMSSVSSRPMPGQVRMT